MRREDVLHILILGPSGQIGYELSKQALSIAEVTTAGRSHADITMDPLNSQALEKLFIQCKPDIVINAIAYTAVDKAETDIETAFELNTDLPASLADLCAKYKCLLIHYSTDFVFDGMQTKPWLEDSDTNPLSIYGRSKLAGEKAIQTSSCSSLILRTSWVYGERGGNFLLTMLRLAKERESLGVVDDQIGSPSCSFDIAQATVELCKQYIADPQRVRNHCGIYNLTAEGETSWHGFAEAIFRIAAENESLAIKELLAIPSKDYPTPAIRPAYSVLNGSKLKQAFGIELVDWQTALNNCMKKHYTK